MNHQTYNASHGLPHNAGKSRPRIQKHAQLNMQLALSAAVGNHFQSCGICVSWLWELGTERN